MKVKNISLEELRKEYKKQENDFFIRIEKDGDKVYYNGIKAFEIKELEGGTEIIIPDNIYNLNKTNIEETKGTILEAITKLRLEMRKYFIKEITKITISITYARYDIEGKNVVEDKIDKIIGKIKEEINEKYKEYIKINDRVAEDIKKEFDKQYKKYQIDKKQQPEKFKRYTKLTYSIPVKFLQEDQLPPMQKDKDEFIRKYIEDITKLEFIFLKNFIFDENMKHQPFFSIPMFSSIQNQYEINKEEYKNFENKIKRAINKYEEITGEEVEKKYQHFFMKSKSLEMKHKVFKGIYRFAEEYYTTKGKDTDSSRGRIDCVFAKIDESNVTNEGNTEIYLIELKVDESVIDGTNGVNKHLKDIEKLKSNEKRFKKFLDRLESDINYALGYSKQKIKINPNRIHFWTIIAISDREHAIKVIDKLIKLTNKETVEKEKNNGKLPKDCVVLDEQIKQLKNIISTDNNEEYVKFFFDKNIQNELSDTYLLEYKSLFSEMTDKDFLKELEKNKII